MTCKIRANIGCGNTPTHGWENFDNSISLKLSTYPRLAFFLHKIKLINNSQMDYISFCQKNKIRWANAIKKIPLADNSVEILYSSHMLEHFDRNEAKFFLKEAKRVMKIGGIIRLVVPDLEKVVERYNQQKDSDAFLSSLLVCQENPCSIFGRIRLAIMGNRHHLWMYDKRSLSNLLSCSGFQDVKILQAGETTITNPRPLDLFERENESIYIEATKN